MKEETYAEVYVDCPKCKHELYIVIRLQPMEMFQCRIKDDDGEDEEL